MSASSENLPSKEPSNSEIEKPQPAPAPSAITFPDGGLKAWLNIVGCFLLSFSSYGQLNAFGVFQTYYAQHQLINHSASEISWIGSVQLVMTYVSGIVLGRVFDIYGGRMLLISGWLLSTFSLMMTSLSTNYYQLFLSHGLGLGIGIALQFYPLLVIPSHWFRMKRGAAMGIVVSGASLSGIIFPIMLSRLFDSVGFPWAVRILAFVVFGCQAIAIPLVKERLPHRLGLPLVDHEAYRDFTFLIHCASGFLVAFALFTPFWYIEIFCLRQGIKHELAFYMISIMNAAGLLGRVLTGYLADRWGRFNVLFLITVISGISSLVLWTQANHLSVTIIFSILFGATSAAYSSICVVCTAQLTSEPTRIGARTGMFMVAMTPGILAGPSISGAILDTNSQFLGLQIWVGVMLIAGAAVSLFVRHRLVGRVFTRV